MPVVIAGIPNASTIDPAVTPGQRTAELFSRLDQAHRSLPWLPYVTLVAAVLAAIAAWRNRDMFLLTISGAGIALAAVAIL